MTTDKQKSDIYFCEQQLNIIFAGNIEDKDEVLLFLSEYLQEAEDLYNELKCEYESYLWDLD